MKRKISRCFDRLEASVRCTVGTPAVANEPARISCFCSEGESGDGDEDGDGESELASAGPTSYRRQ